MSSERVVEEPVERDEHVDSTIMGAMLLMGMVQGSLNSGAMPPPEIFKWACTHAVLTLIEMERAGRFEDASKLAPEAAEFISIAERSQQLGLAHSLKQRLKARCVTLPPELDPTYGGVLSWL